MPKSRKSYSRSRRSVSAFMKLVRTRWSKSKKIETASQKSPPIMDDFDNFENIPCTSHSKNVENMTSDNCDFNNLDNEDMDYDDFYVSKHISSNNLKRMENVATCTNFDSDLEYENNSEINSTNNLENDDMDNGNGNNSTTSLTVNNETDIFNNISYSENVDGSFGNCDRLGISFRENDRVCEDSKYEGNEEAISDASETFYETEIECSISNQPATITGRRIVDILHFLDALKSLKHKGFDCSFYDMNIISEKLEGLQSIFSFKYAICNKVETITSYSDKSSSFGSPNIAAVVGSLATGIGYSQLTELCASLDLPSMSTKTYIKYHREVSLVIDEEVVISMKKAAEEEGRLAAECGEIDQEGTPVISVIVDGAWSKRSYRTNYNALSGVVSS